MVDLKKDKYVYFEEINRGILRQIPYNNASYKPMVLDVGCGWGVLSEAIQNKGYTVWGIEKDEAAASIAASRIAKAIPADLTDLSLIGTTLGGKKFDYLVFSDVLEHLYDPLSILKGYKTFLKEGGHILISVPNMAVWTNRIKLLFGNFNYEDSGVMDRTHIRFFTFKTARLLVAAAGGTVVKVDYTPYLIRSFLPLIKKIYTRKKGADDRRLIIDSPLYAFYKKYIYPLEYLLGRIWRPLFAFQIIIVAKK